MTRRSLTVSIPHRVQKVFTVLGVAALACSWSLKLFLLGN